MEDNKNMVSGKSKCIPIVVEDTAFEGVKKVALKSAGDMEMVCGTRPQVINNIICNNWKKPASYRVRTKWQNKFKQYKWT